MATILALLVGLIDTRILDTSDVAKVTGSTPGSVSRWTVAKATPRREAEDRLLELKAVNRSASGCAAR